MFRLFVCFSVNCNHEIDFILDGMTRKLFFFILHIYDLQTSIQYSIFSCRSLYHSSQMDIFMQKHQTI